MSFCFHLKNLHGIVFIPYLIKFHQMIKIIKGIRHRTRKRCWKEIRLLIMVYHLLSVLLSAVLYRVLKIGMTHMHPHIHTIDMSVSCSLSLLLGKESLWWWSHFSLHSGYHKEMCNPEILRSYLQLIKFTSLIAVESCSIYIVSSWNEL